MRTIREPIRIELILKKEDLYNDVVSVTTVTEKIKELEQKENLLPNSLRSKFYNSLYAGKYNVVEIANTKWLSVTKPMLTENASAIISFTIKED